MLGELDAVVRQDGVNAIGNGFEQVLQELPRCLAVRLVHELGDRELASSVNAHEEEKLSLDRLDLGNIDMEKADWVSLELLPLWFVTLDIRQARDPMPLQAPVQR